MKISHPEPSQAHQKVFSFFRRLFKESNIIVNSDMPILTQKLVQYQEITIGEAEKRDFQFAKKLCRNKFETLYLKSMFA